jgi:RecA/RadA recombinase
MSKKVNATDVADEAKKLYNSEPEIMLASAMPDQQDLRYIEMPPWWQVGTNTRGLPFSKIVMIAGDSDSGKTSACIEAIKAAQQQNVIILYIESEGKTTKQDFLNWGVDPGKMYILQESIAEKIYTKAAKWIKKQGPGMDMLVVIDSVGNVLSMHDSERDLAESSAKPGGKGKSNREGLNQLIALRTMYSVALLVINYTYDNIGSPGKTNAGGKAVNFFSSLTYQTSRKSWIEKTIRGIKIRVGAKVQWKLFKNHIDKANPGPKCIELDITASGISLAGSSDE